MFKKTIILSMIITSLVIPMKIFANIGVGIGTGKIYVDQKLRPGAIYDLPSVSISNTGDEGSDYEVVVQWHSDILELAPDKEWFSFKPQKFHLEPKESRVVEIALELPVKAKPGDYFAYIEGRPVKKESQESGAKIGVAAAAKLYFTVQPANLLAGILNKVASYWKHYAPWTYICVIVLVLAIIILLLRRFMSFKIGIRLKKRTSNQIKENALENSQVADQRELTLLGIAFSKVEEYTDSLTEQQQEVLFEEAKKFQTGIVEYLQKGDESILPFLSERLRNVVLLSRVGLEKVKQQDEEIYQRSVAKVIRGLIGN